MLTQSCAHAMLLCVKPQEAALAHTQQRAPLLRTPLTMKAKKKKEKTHLCTRPKLLQHHKLCCCFLLSIAEVFATISSPPQLRWCTQMQQRFSSGRYTACVVLMTKGNCTPKCIQLCAVIFFSWHIFFFTIKCSPDLITNLQRETRLSGAHVCLLRTGQSSFYSTAQVSYDLKRNVEIGQIYCSRFDWAFCKGTGRNVPPSLRRHLRRLWRGCKPFQDTKLPCYREDQMPRALQRWIVI